MDKVLMNNSPSNIFQPSFWVEGYHQNSQLVLAPAGMNGLKFGAKQNIS